MKLGKKKVTEKVVEEVKPVVEQKHLSMEEIEKLLEAPNKEKTNRLKDTVNKNI